MAQTSTVDRKQIRAAEKAAAVAERERGDVIRSLMSTIPGRKFVWDKLSEANVFATTFNTNPLQFALNEGIRQGGLSLLADIMQWCPEEFIQAMREANGRRTEQHVIDDNARSGTAGERASSEDLGRDLGEPSDPVEADDGFNNLVTDYSADESGAGQVNGHKV